MAEDAIIRALLFDVMALKPDQRGSTSRLRRCGQKPPCGVIDERQDRRNPS
jgi:hypothetical protein